MAFIPHGHPDREKNLARFLDGNHEEVPDVAFHGTMDDFSQFKYESPTRVSRGLNRFGFWFDKNEKTPNYFAGYAQPSESRKPNVIAAHISMKNPLIFASDEIHPELQGKINEMAKKQDWNGINGLLAQKGHDDAFDKLMRLLPNGGRTRDEVVDQIKQQIMDDGYDGIILKNTMADHKTRGGRPTDWYLPFRSEQIKSAFGNQGTFDPNDPDITKAEGGGVIPHGHPDRDKNLARFNPLRDEQAKPKVFYHGTTAGEDFSVFSDENAPYRGGIKAFVSESPKFASSYGGYEEDAVWASREGRNEGRVYPVHINTENPFDFRKQQHVDKVHDFWEETGGIHDPHEAERLGFGDQGHISRKDFLSLVKKGSWDALETPEFVEWLRHNEGHDAVVLMEGGAVNYGLFEPTQIKSATGNQGTFDPNDPDITKAQGGEVEDDGITAYHATWEPFTQYDWSKLGSVTAENSTGGDWASNLAGIGPWAHERDLAKSVGAPVTLPVNITGEPLHFRSLDELERTVSEHGGPEEFRDRMLRQGFGHIVVNDEEFGGKSFVALAPEHFKVKTQNHRLDPKQKRMDKAGGGATDDDGIAAYHGSPHDYPAERLIRSPEGQEQYIVGQPGALPEVPQGATVMQDFPLGRMRMDKIGTGEGAQAFGHGLYTAEAEPVAKGYRDQLALNRNQMSLVDRATGQPLAEDVPGYGPVQSFFNAYAYDMREGDRKHQIEQWATWKKNAEEKLKEWEDLRSNPQYADWIEEEIADRRKQIADYDAAQKLLPKIIAKPLGHMYEVRINAHPDHFLDWDKPLSEQSEHVRAALEGMPLARTDRGGHIWQSLINNMNAEGAIGEHMADPRPAIKTGPKAAMEVLRDAGIKGIKYLDARSRDTGDGLRNYVVFDDKLIDIKRKYADGGVVEEVSGSAEPPKQPAKRKGRASSVIVGERSPIVDRALMLVSRKA